MAPYKFLCAALIIPLISACISSPAKADPVRCDEEFFVYRGSSVDTLVRNAETILIASAEDFVPDTSNPPHEGYYIFVTSGTELKGSPGGQFQVWGSSPFATMPQYYVDITETHQNYDLDNLYGGTTGTVENDDGCFLNPRFLIGWRYLLLLEVNSEMAFEPINSPNIDQWYLAVRDAVARERAAERTE